LKPENIDLNSIIVNATDDDSFLLNELFNKGYETDLFLLRILEMLRSGQRYYKEISLFECFENNQGRLRFRGLLYMLKYDPLKLRILKLCYNSGPAGHPGRIRIYSLIYRTYYWPKDYDYVRKYVRFCQTCRRIKALTHILYGRLKNLGVPDGR